MAGRRLHSWDNHASNSVPKNRVSRRAECLLGDVEMFEGVAL
jgi:hypothetical protein